MSRWTVYRQHQSEGRGTLRNRGILQRTAIVCTTPILEGVRGDKEAGEIAREVNVYQSFSQTLLHEKSQPTNLSKRSNKRGNTFQPPVQMMDVEPEVPSLSTDELAAFVIDKSKMYNEYAKMSPKEADHKCSTACKQIGTELNQMGLQHAGMVAVEYVPQGIFATKVTHWVLEITLPSGGVVIDATQQQFKGGHSQITTKADWLARIAQVSFDGTVTKTPGKVAKFFGAEPKQKINEYQLPWVPSGKTINIGNKTNYMAL